MNDLILVEFMLKLFRLVLIIFLNLDYYQEAEWCCYIVLC